MLIRFGSKKSCTCFTMKMELNLCSFWLLLGLVIYVKNYNSVGSCMWNRYKNRNYRQLISARPVLFDISTIISTLNTFTSRLWCIIHKFSERKILRLCSKKKTFIVSLVFSLDFLRLITELEYTFLYNMRRSGRIHYSSKVTYV